MADAPRCLFTPLQLACCSSPHQIIQCDAAPCANRAPANLANIPSRVPRWLIIQPHFSRWPVHCYQTNWPYYLCRRCPDAGRKPDLTRSQPGHQNLSPCLLCAVVSCRDLPPYYLAWLIVLLLRVAPAWCCPAKENSWELLTWKVSSYCCSLLLLLSLALPLQEGRQAGCRQRCLWTLGQPIMSVCVYTDTSYPHPALTTASAYKNQYVSIITTIFIHNTGAPSVTPSHAETKQSHLLLRLHL